MNKKVYYSLLAITVIVTILAYLFLDKIANWIYRDELTNDYYDNWYTTIKFRRMVGIFNLILLITLTLYSWILIFFKTDINRIILAIIGISGLFLLATVAFFAKLYSYRMI